MLALSCSGCVFLLATACNSSSTGGAHGQHLRHVSVAQLRETITHESVLPPLAQRRGVCHMPVHLVDHGA